MLSQSLSPSTPSFLREETRFSFDKLWASLGMRARLRRLAANLPRRIAPVAPSKTYADGHEEPIDDCLPGTFRQRAWLVAMIVVLYALIGALGSSVAALPMIVGGIGVASMVAWIGWYWADEA